MAITAHHVRPYLGQRIICHSTYGIHSGILHEIRTDGIVLRDARAHHVNAKMNEERKIDHSDRLEELNIQEAFFPFFFLPFLALTAVAASYPWYGYGYGYPGYY